MKTCIVLLGLLVPGLAAAAAPKASSELTDGDGVRHGAEKAFDGLLKTGWGEGDTGSGDGAWLELKLDRATDITSVSIWPGNLEKGARSIREYGRPKLVTVVLTTRDGEVTQQVRVQDPSDSGPKRIDVPVSGSATAVRVKIDEAYRGYVFDDTFIAEVALNYTAGTLPSSVEQAKKWEGSPAAEAAHEKNKTKIVEWYDAIKATELGDEDALAKIMDQAADGAPFMRDRAKNVPYGFRMSALPPDEVAIDALLKLKDPNAIPAIQLAALRSQGKEAKALEARVEYFEAYAELLGGGNRNIPAWGQTGWEKGAFQSFGEPLALVVDAWGTVTVADVGNHRVQQLGSDGLPQRSWPDGEPAISDRWFGKSRRYHVSGAAPAEEDGAFVNPVDVALVPGRDASGFVVLDAAGRVQVFGEDGGLQKSWKLRTDNELEAGVGGSGFVEELAGKVAVVWGDEVFVYTMEGEELANFDVSEGVPNNAVELKGGKLGLVFAQDLVMYSPDGFRHGSVLKTGAGDTRGTSYEDWDAVLDPDGRMWVVTDSGLAIKYKKPGKVDYSVDLGVTFELPRIAVVDDVIWVTDRDRIERFDALELQAQAEAADADK